jgi:hypothetical protein
VYVDIIRTRPLHRFAEVEVLRPIVAKKTEHHLEITVLSLTIYSFRSESDY